MSLLKLHLSSKTQLQHWRLIYFTHLSRPGIHAVTLIRCDCFDTQTLLLLYCLKCADSVHGVVPLLLLWSLPLCGGCEVRGLKENKAGRRETRGKKLQMQTRNSAVKGRDRKRKENAHTHCWLNLICVLICLFSLNRGVPHHRFLIPCNQACHAFPFKYNRCYSLLSCQ